MEAEKNTGSIRRAMILAAGLGTRLKPWTDEHPKALAVVNGKSLLQRNIEYLQQFGIREVIVNVHHFANQVVAALEQNKGWGSRVVISDETGAVLETGGGLLKAAPLLLDSDPFVLMNVDILTDLDLDSMAEYHDEQNALATLAVSDRVTSRYFLFDEESLLSGWRKIPAANAPDAQISEILKEGTSSNLHQKAFSGIHIISPAIFPLITQEGKFSIVDVYLELMHEHDIFGYDHTGSKFIDVGKPESILKAEAMWP